MDCKEYQEIKSIYQEEQQEEYEGDTACGQHLLDQVKARMDWTEESLKYQRFQKIEKGIADRFIEKITVYSKDYVEIVFWFGILFERSWKKNWTIWKEVFRMQDFVFAYLRLSRDDKEKWRKATALKIKGFNSALCRKPAEFAGAKSFSSCR